MSGPFKLLITTTVNHQNNLLMTSVVADFDNEIGAEIAIKKLEKSNEEETCRSFIRATRLYIPQSESGL